MVVFSRAAGQDLRHRLADGVLVIVGGSVVSSLLNVIPILGFIAGAFVGFYTIVAAYYIIGHTWADIEHARTRERPDSKGQVQI